MDKASSQDQAFYVEISDLLKQARNQTYRAVNSIMVKTYWQIGKRIVEQEQKGKARSNYGDHLITNLSKHLTGVFGKGFSESNLWRMVQFHKAIPNFLEFSPQCGENLSWTNIRRIMRLKTKEERDFYINEASSQSWSSRQLDRNIKSGYYQRTLSNKKSAVVPDQAVHDPASFIKDPFILEFLDVPEDLNGKESLLENALIGNLQKFLLELGKGFCFVDRQMRISADETNFYIDLVFYNHILKCFVIIDLKAGKLSLTDLAQVDMYVRMFDALKRGEDDNPTIGIVLCAAKNDTVVKYSSLNEVDQLYATEYKTVLPSEEELNMLADQNRKLIEEQNGTDES